MLRVQSSTLSWMLCFLVWHEADLGAGSTGVGNSKENSSEVKLTCNGTDYNPAKATCCEDEIITESLSENMSQCCGKRAFNPLNEICCDSTLHAKLSPNTSCCDKEPFEKTKQLCCGIQNKILMTRLSSDHRCCYSSQYNIKLECCCEELYPRVQLKIIKDNERHCCEKNITNIHSSTSIQSTNEIPKVDLGYFKNSSGGKLGKNETNCNNGNRTETYFKKQGFKCCGHYYYNTSLWSCCKNRLIPLFKPKWILIFANYDICV